MSIQVSASVSQPVYDLGLKLAAIVAAIKTLPPNSGPIGDIMAFLGPVVGELSAIQADINAVPAEWKADPFAVVNGAFLGVEVALQALLAPVPKA